MFPSRFRSLQFIVLFAIFLAGILQIQAQTTTGTIYGVVADPTGAVVPNVEITAVNVATHESHTVRTNGTGEYSFLSLNPGNYEITAKVAGFQSVTQTGITLSANQNIHANFALTTGTMDQTVTVNAATTLVDTRENQLGQTIDQGKIEDLPLESRVPYSLVQTLPGVGTYTPALAIGASTGVLFSMNGLRNNMNTYYLDGAYDVAPYRGGGPTVPNPDALQEFRVLTSNFDAEFGRMPGAVVNIITRSGQNRWHGMVYDYIRNDALNAPPSVYFPVASYYLKENTFGANGGGAVIRDKAFFFLSYEGNRTHSPYVVNSGALVVPPDDWRSGNFTNAATVPNVSCMGVHGQICSGALDPVAQNILQYIPHGVTNYNGSGKETGATIPAQEMPENIKTDQGMARIDYQLTSAHRISATYFEQQGTMPEYNAGGNQILDFSGDEDYAKQINGILGDQWIISPNAVNSARIYYSDDRLIVSNIYPNQLWQNFGSHIAEGAPSATQPLLVITGFLTMGDAGSGVDDIDEDIIGAANTYNLNRGKHSIKLGGTYVLNLYHENGILQSSGKLTFSGGTTGNAMADFLVGSIGTFIQTTGYVHRLRSPNPSLFVQDDWHLLPRLTLDLGLRWEGYTPYYGQNNTGTFVPGVQSQRFPTAPVGLLTSGDPGVPDGIVHSNYKKFAPRFGFALDLFGDGRTSLRGGYGIFYAGTQVNFSDLLEQQPFTLSVTTSATPVYNGITYGLVDPYGGNSPFPYTVNLQNPKFSTAASIAGVRPGYGGTPYTQEYNLTLEQQLTRDLGLQVSYVGSVSRKYWVVRDQNTPVFAPGASVTTAGLNARRPYKPYGQISLLDPTSDGNYNSLQVAVNKQLSHGLSFLASYVWEKVMDYDSADAGSLTGFTLSDESSVRRDYGLSTLDLPQKFVASYTWTPPTFHRLGLLGHEVIDGWQFNGITTFATGNPFNITSGSDTNRDGISTTDRPNMIADPRLPGNRSTAAKIAKYFNTAAFAAVTDPNQAYGTSPRDPVVGPGTINTDFSTFKNFALPLDARLQFRVEIFNLFNNLNLNNPTASFSSANFGAIGGAADLRVFQLALKLQY